MTYIRITNWVLQTAAEWTASLQVLHTWEAGIESDTGKVKRGNGLDVYSSLSYLAGFGGGGGGPETDPVFSAWLAGPPALSEFADDVGYLLAANNLSDLANKQTARQNLFPSFTGNAGKFMAVNVTEDDIEFITLTGGGDLLSINNLSDVANPITALANLGISGTDISNWNAAFGWGNHALAGYLTAETDPVFTAWLGTNDYLSSSTTSVQDGYFNSINLKDQQTPSHYLHITVEDNLTATRNLEINVADGNKSLTIAGNASISGTHSGNSSNNNTGDQTSIVGISGTKAQFDTACTDGNFLYVGDVVTFSDEAAQDAVGAMVDSTLVYVDGTPLLTRAALTGAITAAQGSNTTALGSFTKSQLDTAVSDGNVLYVGDVTQYTDEMVDDRVSALMQNGIAQTWTYDDTANTLTPKPNPVYNMQLTRYNINTFMHY